MRYAAMSGWILLWWLVGASAGLALADDGTDRHTGKQRVNVFEGCVLDSHRRPVAGATVAVADAKLGNIAAAGEYRASAPSDTIFLFVKKRNGLRAAQVVTDIDGRFAIRSLKHGHYTFLAHHAEKGTTAMADLSFHPETAALEVVLKEPVFIEGQLTGFEGPRHVVFEPHGLPDRIFFRFSASLNSDGAFESGPLPQADLWTTTASTLVKDRGYAATLLQRSTQIEPGATARIDLDFTAGSQLTGQVLGPKGEVLPGVSVVAKPKSGDGWAIGAVTDEKGKYALTGLRDGSYELTGLRHTRRTAPG